MKPENTFIRSVHKLLALQVYCEKMCNPYRSGTADVWYSGHIRDLWLEYKWLPALPERVAILPALSPQQRRWINNRYIEGRNVGVVVGCPAGGVLFMHQLWERPMGALDFRAHLLSRRQLADWILANVGGSTCPSPSVSSTLRKSSRRLTASS